MPTQPAQLLPKHAIARNNAISVFLMGALPAVAGSAISFLLSAFFVWGIFSAATGRYELHLTQGDRVLAWIFSAFALFTLVTAVVAPRPGRGLVELISYLPFLSLWVVIPRLRATPALDYLPLYSVGAAVGTIGATIVALVEMSYGLRPEGGAGNSAVFAIMSLSLSAVAAVNLTSPFANLRRLALAGILAGMIAVTLSLTRGVWIAVPVVLLLIAAYGRERLLRVPLGPAIIASAIALAGVASIAGDRILARVAGSISDYETLGEGQVSPSLGHRVQLWGAGLEAFQASPFWGHGIQNRMKAVADHLPSGGSNLFNYSHVHNGLMNVAIDGGIALVLPFLLVLAGPIMIARAAIADPRHRSRHFLALSVSTIYVICGMTQITFNHDVMDSFYIFNAILVAASIPLKAQP